MRVKLLASSSSFFFIRIEQYTSLMEET